MKTFATACAMAAVALFAALPARAEPTVLKFGSTCTPDSTMCAAMDEFARRVNEKLGDKVKVETFHSSQLGNDKELLQKLKLGTADFSTPSTIMSSVKDIYGVFDMPYLIENRRHMARVSEKIVMPELAPLVEPEGYKILAVWENGFRDITNNVRPIVTPKDLQGIKLRTPRGVWRIKMFEAYGASPTPMAFSELFVALQTGVMDGQENPLVNIWGGRLHEVQKYLSMSNHVYTPVFMTVGKKKWEKLPEDVRTEMEKIAQELQPWIYDYAEKAEGETLKKLKDAGMQVNDVDRAAFIAASKPVYELFGQEVKGGDDLVKRIQALAEGS